MTIRTEPTHRYVGPDTRWGLKNGTVGWKIKGRAGGAGFKRQGDGEFFTVARHQVEKISER